MSAIRHLVRKSYKHKDKPHILCLFYDSFFERDLSKLDCCMYGDVHHTLIQYYNFKDYNPLNIQFGMSQDTIFDFILCNDRKHQYPLAQNLARAYHIPIIMADHQTYQEQLNPAEITSLENDTHAVYYVSCNNCVAKQWKQSDAIINYGIEIPEAKTKDIEFLIAGNFAGDDLIAVRNMAKSLNAIVVGPNQEVQKSPQYYLEWLDYFQRAKIFINLSTTTSLSRELLTAMACGCGIITNSTSTIRHILVHNQNCIMIENIEEVCPAAQSLSKSKHIDKLSNKNIKLIQENFTTEQFLTKWHKVFTTIQNRVFVL